MGVFGPRYSPELQAVVNHAERFCELLARLEDLYVRRDGSHGWLTSRREEVEAVLGLVIDDWAADRIDERQATREAAQYLDELHAGARRSLGLGPVLGCCEEDEARTVSLATNCEALTHLGPDRVLRKETGQTWFDPSALLDVHETPSAPRESSGRTGRLSTPSRPEIAAIQRKKATS
jgi:hypothetical protein